MESELAELESRLEQLITLHLRAEADNVGLRARVAELEAARRAQEAKLERALGRLDALLETLPED
ncbi:MAG: hypothetical protein RBR77_02505 [Thauera sp.]|jgi:hypothetical protein|nr:hypothetical protein [Thauera sp.]